MIGCTLTVFERCHSCKTDLWQQVGNYTRATDAEEEMGFEVVMEMRAFWPKQSLGYYPNPHCCPSPDPHLPSPWLRCRSCVEVNWTRSFWISAINPTHHAVTMLFFSFFHSHTQMDRDNSPGCSVWRRTGNKCLRGRGAPSCAFPQGRHPPNSDAMCVSWFNLPSKTETELFLFTSCFSHTWFSSPFFFLILAVSLLPLFAFTGCGKQWSFVGGFLPLWALLPWFFCPDDPINVFILGFLSWQHRAVVLQ